MYCTKYEQKIQFLNTKSKLQEFQKRKFNQLDTGTARVKENHSQENKEEQSEHVLSLSLRISLSLSFHVPHELDLLISLFFFLELSLPLQHGLRSSFVYLEVFVPGKILMELAKSYIRGYIVTVST